MYHYLGSLIVFIDFFLNLLLFYLKNKCNFLGRKKNIIIFIRILELYKLYLWRLLYFIRDLIVYQ